MNVKVWHGVKRVTELSYPALLNEAAARQLVKFFIVGGLFGSFVACLDD
jgi:hypothetical protein